MQPIDQTAFAARKVTRENWYANAWAHVSAKPRLNAEIKMRNLGNFQISQKSPILKPYKNVKIIAIL